MLNKKIPRTLMQKARAQASKILATSVLAACGLQ